MKEIITINSENKDILSERCHEVEINVSNGTFKDGKLVQEITLQLKDTIRNNKNCVGLSANQIGYDKRMFCINFNGDIKTYINPIIYSASGLMMSRESCMSVPDKEFIMPRNSSIVVNFYTPLGKPVSQKLMGRAACVFQHELNHLDGITLADGIALEIDEDYDNAPEEEKAELLKKYLESLDLKLKDTQKEIQQTPELKQMDDAIKFMEGVQKGEVTVELGETDKETKDKINEKLNSLNK